MRTNRDNPVIFLVGILVVGIFADDTLGVDDAVDDPAGVESAVVEPAFVDPAFVDPTLVDPAPCTCAAVLHEGHKGSAGLQLYSQSLTIASGKSRARLRASVVFPMPGGPTMMICRPVSHADLSWRLVPSWPKISSKVASRICVAVGVCMDEVGNPLFKKVGVESGGVFCSVLQKGKPGVLHIDFFR